MCDIRFLPLITLSDPPLRSSRVPAHRLTLLGLVGGYQGPVTAPGMFISIFDTPNERATLTGDCGII